MIKPVRRSVHVERPQEHVFGVFVDRMAAWWPMVTHSIGETKVETVEIERHLGGRVFERWTDGNEETWGKVLVWDPPERFTISWELHDVPTEVEVVFLSLGPALTRVELEHRGWDGVPESALAERLRKRANYDDGWAAILARFAEVAAA